MTEKKSEPDLSELKILLGLDKAMIAKMDAALACSAVLKSLQNVVSQTGKKQVRKIDENLVVFRDQIERAIGTDGYSSIGVIREVFALSKMDWEPFIRFIGFILKYRQELLSAADMDRFFLTVVNRYCFEYDSKAYIFGGFVRDKFLGVQSNDIDIKIAGNARELSVTFTNAAWLFKNKKFLLDQPAPDIESYSLKWEEEDREGYDISSTEDIFKSLREADFTVNGLGIEISRRMDTSGLNALLDDLLRSGPLGGRALGLVVSPDPQFLKDAKDKVFRLTDHGRKETSQVYARSLKFLERCYRQSGPSGISFDDELFAWLVQNSRKVRAAAIQRLFVTKYAKEFVKPKDIFLQIIIDLYRTHGKRKDLQGLLEYYQGMPKSGATEDDLRRAFDASFVAIYGYFEEFIYSSSSGNINIENFLKFLRDHHVDVDYYGLEEIGRVYASDDPHMVFVRDMRGSRNKTYRKIIETLSGSGKWLTDFEGDPDERFYRCMEFFESRVNLLQTMFDGMLVSNLKHLKVKDLKRRLLMPVRFAALIAHFSPADLHKAVGDLFVKQVISDKQSLLIQTLVDSARWLVRVDTEDLEKKKEEEKKEEKEKKYDYDIVDRSIAQYLIRQSKSITGAKKVFDLFGSNKDYSPVSLLDMAYRIAHSCASVEDKRLRLPPFSDIEPEKLEQAKDKILGLFSDHEMVAYLSEDIYPLVATEDILGLKVGDTELKDHDMVKVGHALRKYKLANGWVPKEELIEFLKTHMAEEFKVYDLLPLEINDLRRARYTKIESDDSFMRLTGSLKRRIMGAESREAGEFLMDSSKRDEFLEIFRSFKSVFPVELNVPQNSSLYTYVRTQAYTVLHACIPFAWWELYIHPLTKEDVKDIPWYLISAFVHRYYAFVNDYYEKSGKGVDRKEALEFLADFRARMRSGRYDFSSYKPSKRMLKTKKGFKMLTYDDVYDFLIAYVPGSVVKLDRGGKGMRNMLAS